jgi:hypothetical protein
VRYSGRVEGVGRDMGCGGGGCEGARRVGWMEVLRHEGDVVRLKGVRVWVGSERWLRGSDVGF